MTDSDVVHVFLSEGWVECGHQGCSWEKVGGTFPEQCQALHDHIRAEHHQDKP